MYRMPSVGQLNGDGRRDRRFTDAALPHRHYDTVAHGSLPVDAFALVICGTGYRDIRSWCCSQHHIHCSGGGDKASRKWLFRADWRRCCQAVPPGGDYRASHGGRDAPPAPPCWRSGWWPACCPLKGTLRPVHRNGALQLVVLAQGAHTITTLMIAAFHENWTVRFALSPGDAMALLRKAPSVALVYDWDSHEGDWRELCDACVHCGVHFHLVASMPPDDLFLAVAGAGGSGGL